MEMQVAVMSHSEYATALEKAHETVDVAWVRSPCACIDGGTTLCDDCRELQDIEMKLAALLKRAQDKAART